MTRPVTVNVTEVLTDEGAGFSVKDTYSRRSRSVNPSHVASVMGYPKIRQHVSESALADFQPTQEFSIVVMGSGERIVVMGSKPEIDSLLNEGQKQVLHG